MMNKAKSGKYAPAIMRAYSLNKKNTVSENGPSDTRRKGLKYMSVTGRETLTSTQIRNKQGDTSERPNLN